MKTAAAMYRMGTEREEKDKDVALVFYSRGARMGEPNYHFTGLRISKREQLAKETSEKRSEVKERSRSDDKRE
jgi:hypothetical protein